MHDASLRVELDCPRCSRSVTWRVADGEASRPCAGGCGWVLHPIVPDPLARAALLERCVSCGEHRLYRQRDFNRKVGLLVVLGGALLSLALLPVSPLWAYGVLFLLAAVDLAMYLRLPEVAICYRCQARHRGFSGDSRLDPFDLLTQEMVDHQEKRERDSSSARSPP